MFDKFKENHGGLGPFQALNSALTGGEGIAGRLGVKHARSVLNSIIDEQQGDAELGESLAPVWDNLKRTRMTEADLEKSASLLVQRGADIKQLGQSFGDFGELQKRYRGAAANKDDLAILDGLDTQAKIAHDMVRSANPQIAQKGQEFFGKVLDAQREFATKNEEQRIASDNLYGAHNTQVFNSLQDNYKQESQAFLNQRRAFGTMKAALAVPDSAAGDMALIYSYLKILDPNSTVLPGEYAGATNAAGVPDIVMTAYNRLVRDGQRLTPDQRKDFFNNANAAYQQGRGEQAERDTRYLGQARDNKLPEELLRHFVFPLDSPGEAPSDFGAAQNQAASAPAPESDSTARMVGESVASGVGTAVSGAADAVTGLVWPSIKALDRTIGESLGFPSNKPEPRTAQPPSLTLGGRSYRTSRNTDEFR